MPQPQSAKRPDVPLHRALIPVALLIALLGASVYLFGDDSSSGPNQIALVLGTAVAAVVGLVGGQRWKELEQAISQGISTSMGAILISDGWSFSTPTGNSASVPAMPIGSTQVPGTSRYRVAPASILRRPRSRLRVPSPKTRSASLWRSLSCAMSIDRRAARATSRGDITASSVESPLIWGVWTVPKHRLEKRRLSTRSASSSWIRPASESLG